MFLNGLTQEERTKFMELVYYIANIDGDYAEEEKELIKNYQVELNMSVLPKMTDSIDDLVSYFAGKSEGLKKIIIFEIYGLIMSDDSISPKEKEIVDDIDRTFGIEVSTMSMIKDLVKKLKNVYDKIYTVLS
ncbi:hypothetical protein [Clostridium tyrobutyricum]|uniref:hypothetical protein n=1 Tax=Clostridium tyrobutyricum TaxID=1519 RepID=UPI001C38C11A|nr:hypothetical protein [Clostridium tyrobutyricum]MBV4416537.1 hypothetical protein [Clostridium tyrobutyricum]